MTSSIPAVLGPVPAASQGTAPTIGSTTLGGSGAPVFTSGPPASTWAEVVMSGTAVASAAARARTSGLGGAAAREGGAPKGTTSADTVPRLAESVPPPLGNPMTADPEGSTQNPATQDGGPRPPPSSVGRSGKKRKAKGKTPFAKRYQALRPVGRHPGLKPWDNLSREVRSSLAGQERRIFARTGLLVGRVDLQLYQLLEEHGSHLLVTTFPRAPVWWPSDWGKVPVPMPLEVTLYRHQLKVAGDVSVLWLELYQLCLEQTAAGWDLEYSDPIKSRKHTLPTVIAKAILEVGGFAFLSSASDTLAVFRSHHSLNDTPIPTQQAARQVAWVGIHRARQLETMSRSSPARTMCPMSSVSPTPSRGWEMSPSLPSTPSAFPADGVQRVLDASGLPGALRDALAGEAELYVNTTEKVVAVATAGLRLAEKMSQARERVADLVRNSTGVVDPARLETELVAGLNSFPSLARNLPRLFHTELGQILGRLGNGAGSSL